MIMADEDLFEELPDQKRPQPEDRGAPRLRVPERSQVDTHWAALDDLIADDHPVRAVWGVCRRARSVNAARRDQGARRAAGPSSGGAAIDDGALVMGDDRW